MARKMRVFASGLTSTEAMHKLQGIQNHGESKSKSLLLEQEALCQKMVAGGRLGVCANMSSLPFRLFVTA